MVSLAGVLAHLLHAWHRREGCRSPTPALQLLASGPLYHLPRAIYSVTFELPISAKATPQGADGSSGGRIQTNPGHMLVPPHGSLGRLESPRPELPLSPGIVK